LEWFIYDWECAGCRHNRILNLKHACCYDQYIYFLLGPQNFATVYIHVSRNVSLGLLPINTYLVLGLVGWVVPVTALRGFVGLFLPLDIGIMHEQCRRIALVS
jgi:hypothetical protein